MTPGASITARTHRHLLDFDLQDVDWVDPSNRDHHCAIFMNKVFHTFDTKVDMQAFCRQSSLLFTEYSPPSFTHDRDAERDRAG